MSSSIEPEPESLEPETDSVEQKVLMVDESAANRDANVQSAVAYGRLAMLTRDVMTKNSWTYRRAQIETGISFNAIERMSKGVAVETDTVIAFARAIAPKGKEVRTVIDWLRAAEKDNIANFIENAMITQDEQFFSELEAFKDAYLASDWEHRTLALQILKLGNIEKNQRARLIPVSNDPSKRFFVRAPRSKPGEET